MEQGDEVYGAVVGMRSREQRRVEQEIRRVWSGGMRLMELVRVTGDGVGRAEGERGG